MKKQIEKHNRKKKDLYVGKMDRRNIVSGVLVCLLIVNSAIATTITIKNIDTIIQEFDDLFEDPFFHNDTDAQELEGTLKVFFSSNISQQVIIETEYLKNSLLPIVNQTYTILEVGITITKIDLIGEQSPNATFLQTSNRINLFEGINNTEFFKSASIKEGIYSAIFLYFDENIQVETTEGTQNLILQGSTFVVLPFAFLNDNSINVDLEIIKGETAQLVLNFDIILIWITNSATIVLNALIIP